MSWVCAQGSADESENEIKIPRASRFQVAALALSTVDSSCNACWKGEPQEQGFWTLGKWCNCEACACLAPCRVLCVNGYAQQQRWEAPVASESAQQRIPLALAAWCKVRAVGAEGGW